jgi:hypothetical protein
MSKGKLNQKLGLLCLTAKSWMKLLERTENASPMNSWTIKKSNSLTVDLVNILVAWTEDQNSHNIPISQSLTQSKALTLQFCEG